MKFWNILLFAVLTPLMLTALECSVCSKNIRGRYVRDNRNRTYCSQKCFHSTLPKCANCKKPCTPRVITMQKQTFCSRACLHQVFNCSVCGKGASSFATATNQFGTTVRLCPQCRRRPNCVYCSLPCLTVPLPDGRHICKKCKSTAVSDPRKIRAIFRQVRSDMAKMFGYDSRHSIELHVVDAIRLNREAKSTYRPANGMRTGLMVYHLRTTVRRNHRGKKSVAHKSRCQIFVLDNIPEAQLYDVFAHELTHDFLRHQIGKVRNSANEEGFCELAASLYNQKRSNHYLNRAKEVNPDPVYGNGYRRMRDIYRRTRDFRKTMQYVK